MIASWASTYAGRRSHDKPLSETSPNSRSSSPEADARISSSSEATPRPTPAPHPQHLGNASAHDTNLNMLGSSQNSDFTNSSRRLGFFTDKHSTSAASHVTGAGHTVGQRSVLTGTLHSHNTRSDSPLGMTPGTSAVSVTTSLSSSSSGHTAGQRGGLPGLLNPLRSESALSMASGTSSVTLTNPSNHGKLHNTPSKSSPGRTYDSKLVTREMHRLGNISHFPAGLAPPLATAASASSLPGPSCNLVNMTAALSGENPWGSLHVHLLPLFNGEPLRIPIEDLNLLVKRHIQTVISQSLSKALSTLESDASELIASGMVTLNAKLVGLEDDKLLGRVVEIWGFFWDQVLTYVEGALLPLQTDSLISSLYRTPKTRRDSSPSRSASGFANNVFHSVTYPIDVRSVALRSFRDMIILPHFPRLQALLSVPNRQDFFSETTEFQEPRLQQMLHVLASQSRTRPPSFSLTAPAPQPTAGEAAITSLIRVLRAPLPQSSKQAALNASSSTGQFPILAHAPSFLSGSLPRDRRGRVAQKQKEMSVGVNNEVSNGVFGDGGETPRKGLGMLTADIERERELLDALKSPDVGSRASVGGWGLGVGIEDNSKINEDDDEDETLDWDQAQAVVERMVGMKPEASPERRRA